MDQDNGCTGTHGPFEVVPGSCKFGFLPALVHSCGCGNTSKDCGKTGHLCANPWPWICKFKLDTNILNPLENARVVNCLPKCTGCTEYWIGKFGWQWLLPIPEYLLGLRIWIHLKNWNPNTSIYLLRIHLLSWIRIHFIFGSRIRIYLPPPLGEVNMGPESVWTQWRGVSMYRLMYGTNCVKLTICCFSPILN